MADYYLTQTGPEVQDILDSVGDLDDLTTTDKDSVVDAINELDTDLGSVETDVGDLTQLTTTAQSDLVSAINEVDGDVSGKAVLAISTTVTLASASWVSSSGLYTQAATVTGLLATDVPFCQAVCDDSTDADAWSQVIKAVPTADTLTFTALESLSVDLDVQVVVFR